MHELGNWLYHYGGLQGTGPWYAFWSGIFADITLPAFIVGGLRHVNCGHKGCWRPYHRITKDGHKLCRKHIQMPLSELNLIEAHPDHL